VVREYYTVRERRHTIAELSFYQVYTKHDPVIIIEVGGKDETTVFPCSDSAPVPFEA
jgi:hypothetical protein